MRRPLLVVGCLLWSACALHRDAIGAAPAADADRDTGTAADAGAVDAPSSDSALVDAGDAGDASRADTSADTGPDVAVDSGCGTPRTRCVGSDVERCTSAGVLTVNTCALGCRASACLRVDIAHLSGTDRDVIWQPTVTSLTVAGGSTVTFDTDTGRVTDGGTELRPPGPDTRSGIHFLVASQGPGWPEIAVFTLGQLTVDAMGVLTASGARALLIVSQGAVLIDGTVDVGGQSATPGPGAGAGGGRQAQGTGPAGAGGAPGQRGGGGDWRQSGGGGGGHAGAGGAGGDVTAGGGTTGGAGGAVIADMDGTPLSGGGGGGGGADGSSGGPGGGGGGAIQITSAVSITVSATGTIRAPGGRGRGGIKGGGGGGAGGIIFLEAPSVDVGGAIMANGGSGGGGTSSGTRGDDGARGPDGVGPAGGGAGAGWWGGDGGDGSTATSLAGANAGNATEGTGGGGGAAGRLRFVGMAGGIMITGATSPTEPSAHSRGTLSLY